VHNHMQRPFSPSLEITPPLQPRSKGSKAVRVNQLVGKIVDSPSQQFLPIILDSPVTTLPSPVHSGRVPPIEKPQQAFVGKIVASESSRDQNYVAQLTTLHEQNTFHSKPLADSTEKDSIPKIKSSPKPWFHFFGDSKASSSSPSKPDSKISSQPASIPGSVTESESRGWSPSHLRKFKELREYKASLTDHAHLYLGKLKEQRQVRLLQALLDNYEDFFRAAPNAPDECVPVTPNTKTLNCRVQPRLTASYADISAVFGVLRMACKKFKTNCFLRSLDRQQTPTYLPLRDSFEYLVDVGPGCVSTVYQAMTNAFDTDKWCYTIPVKNESLLSKQEDVLISG